MINAMEQNILATLATLKKETEQYTKVFMVNKHELTIRQNDLAVFSFMLKLVKCKKAAAFVQLDQHPAICETEEGIVFDLGNKEAEAEIQRKMTPSARAAIREILGRVEAVQAQNAASFLQKSVPTRDGGNDEDSLDDDDADETAKNAQTAISSLGVASDGQNSQSDDKPKKKKKTPTTTAGLPTPPVPKAKVVKRVEEGHWKCTNGPVDCGLLHDTMSLMWGKFKDLVDELQAEMDKNEFEFEELKFNYNQQLEVLRSSKAKFGQDLAEATGNLNSDREEMAEKEEMRVTLEHEYKVYMKQCKARIEWIMFQDICAYLKVRSTFMTFSKVSPPEKITDC